jgi:hypothetical protein
VIIGDHDPRRASPENELYSAAARAAGEAEPGWNKVSTGEALASQRDQPLRQADSDINAPELRTSSASTGVQSSANSSTANALELSSDSTPGRLSQSTNLGTADSPAGGATDVSTPGGEFNPKQPETAGGITVGKLWINLARIDSADDVKAVIAETARAGAAELEQARRGSRTHAETQAAAAREDAFKVLMERRAQGGGAPLSIIAGAPPPWRAKALADCPKPVYDRQRVIYVVGIYRPQGPHHGNRENLLVRTLASCPPPQGVPLRH